MSDTPTEPLPSTEAIEPSTEDAAPPVKTKAPRTDAQKAALDRAREKAMAVRAQNASLKRKEQEVERALAQKAKEERAARVEAEYEALSKPPIEAEPMSPLKKKRKPARKVVVTEVSSASESEASEVEVVLPRARKKQSPEEAQYQQSMLKMFEPW